MPKLYEVIDDAGVKKAVPLSGKGGESNIPIASSTTLGGIKVGNNLFINEDGTLNVISNVGYKLIINTTTEFEGLTVTVSKGNYSHSAIVVNQKVIIIGLEEGGVWTISEDSSGTSIQTDNLIYYGEYSYNIGTV